MKRKNLKVCLILFTVFLSAFGASTSVINSNDWQTVIKSMNHAGLEGKETFTVVTPQDAEIARKTIENPETLYRSKSETFSDLSERTGLQFNEERLMTSGNISSSSEGYVVVQGKFGTDSVAVLPYALRNKYSIVYYSEEAEDFLSQSDKQKLFYGEFDFNVSGRFGNSELINGSWQDMNLEVADRMNSDWAVLSPRGYFDPESLDREPVLFRMENKEKLANYIDDSDIKRLKVVGAENMLYAKEIDILTEKNLAITVKTGRAFTGIPGYDGIYDVKKVDIPFRRYNAQLEEVAFDRNRSVLELNYVNRGNTVRNVEGALGGNDKRDFELVLPEFSSLTRQINVSENISSFQLNYSIDDERYTRNINVDEISSIRAEKEQSIVLNDFNRSEDALEVKLTNAGSEENWVMVQADDNYLRKSMAPGESASFRFEGASNTEKISVFSGGFENQLTESTVFELEESGRSLPLSAIVLIIIALMSLMAFAYRKISY